MSYCRKNEESDVYMYATESDIVCQECKIISGKDDICCPNAYKALRHLLWHRREGHKVPQSAIDRLEGEIRGE